MTSPEQHLTPEEQLRYSRQISVAGFGLEGQLKLKSSRVTLIGAGGLGCPIGIYLAAAGVGFISVVDHDLVELSNIHRQTAFKATDIKKPKAQTLVDTMRSINPDLHYQYHNACLGEDNAQALLKDQDLVIDGTDNFPSKFLIADSCHSLGVPLLHGSVHQFSAQVILFDHANGPCLRCLYNQPPTLGPLAACDQAGVLGPVAGTVGMLMASEAVKFLSGMKCPTIHNLIKYDALKQSIQIFALENDPACPFCGKFREARAISNQRCVSSERSNSEQCHEDGTISIQRAQQLISQGAFVLDVREPSELVLGSLPDAALIPLARLPEELALRVPLDKPIVVYCQHGVRSLAAVNYMRTAGYQRSYSIAGGFAAWPQCTS